MTAAVIPFNPHCDVVQIPVVRALADDVIRYVAACQTSGARPCPAGLAAYLHVARDIAEREIGVNIR